MTKIIEPIGTRAATTQDRELVLAARSGETWAAEALYRRHSKMVQRIASRFTETHDRDDLVQDSFLKALCCLDQIEYPELFPSWLASVVTRTAAHGIHNKRRLRRLNRASAIAPEHLTSQPAPPDVFAELRSIYRLLDRLPVEARLVFILRRVERMSIEEVAARVGRSAATVKRRLARAQRLLSRRTASGIPAPTRTHPARATGKKK